MSPVQSHYNRFGFVPPQYAIISCGNGTSAVVPTPPAGKQIVLCGYAMSAKSLTSVHWESQDGTDLSGDMQLAIGTPLCPSFSPRGLLVALPGQALMLTVNTNTTVAGHLQYVVV